MNWKERTHEERALLNPGFCANVLWHAGIGFASEANRGFSFTESFLVLPMVLDKRTRGELPRSTRTSLAVWLERYPLLRGRIRNRAKSLVEYTREALLFASTHGFIEFNGLELKANKAWATRVRSENGSSSDEVLECKRKAKLVGKWFGQISESDTTLALMGVRP